MKKGVLAILIGLGLVAVAVVAVALRSQSSTSNTQTANANAAVMDSSTNTSAQNLNRGQSASSSNTASQPVDTNTPTNAAATSTSTPTAQYVDYSTAALAQAQQRGRTVLYFHADWCPVCRALDPDIQSNISTFPADVTILKVDYDEETSLKQQYGVTYQHTFVQVDASGKELKQWSGGDAKAASVAENIL